MTDQGIGIPPEAIPGLFRRYHRGEDARRVSAEGLGIGLHVSYAIAKAHGGSIRVQSKPGEGSTFTVELPIKMPHLAAASGESLRGISG